MVSLLITFFLPLIFGCGLGAWLVKGPAESAWPRFTMAAAFTACLFSSFSTLVAVDPLMRLAIVLILLIPFLSGTLLVTWLGRKGKRGRP
ncbi:hypothetical protein LAZ40_10970 [Cereibacter sphaeroides]|uniref:hypothetical protein n=1 Tax=Cereibacter sphaeroides TaxID=1063 RepID=UPI001F2DE754|nr:hypothetical protein [Cereibacter sphaeroides]MCE6959577.1 hypothetical protein [Cereibacter sphaeroides]MCE6974563.1 hypothetical protein [Cereibacter sphaeroides]